MADPVQMASDEQDMPMQPDGAEGVRWRSAAACPATAPQMPGASAGAGGSSTAPPRRHRCDRGQADGPPPPPALQQLFRPPQSRRAAVLMVVDCLTFLVALSCVALLVDLVRHPPSFPPPSDERTEPPA
eukprot:gnl/TRDRNA2_/TRDRNA2_198694_c0_seq1.p3 gnl/TRDRNA2_/TRDRNA2_198694_c0~~gnl/TRDRNA2_/TRDRNA2_198694_c0_seq1.p3  ORF type:complete len:129 (-),score=15.95 gnl/TRDRNA2_/TRDRNA2_198694_c0_seq1:36-422(-)